MPEFNRHIRLNDVQHDVANDTHRDWKRLSPERRNMMAFFGLAEEAGEVVGIAKRLIRHEPRDISRSNRDALVSELGDVLWYLAAVALENGIDLEYAWVYNRLKLEERYGRKEQSS